MATKKKRSKITSLAQGRPRNVKSTTSLSSKATRTLIRTHHTLEKQKAKALADGDHNAALGIQKQIEKQGGIEKYQRASLLGQAKERGGDSSKILIDWLKPISPALKARAGSMIRLLEVGALSTTNACAKSKLFDITRIDLNSQAEGITQQDFMDRPLPKLPSEKFDIISLSLVLNYVPEPIGRGEMLKRTLKFLRTLESKGEGEEELVGWFPSLFLVLPLSCVTNSRYMDEPRLGTIMKSLGYVLVQRKLSNKLAYYLWKATELTPRAKPETFKKVELRAGGTRNNFAVVIK